MKYRRRPYEIEAIQFNGKNWCDLEKFTNGTVKRIESSEDVPYSNFLEKTGSIILMTKHRDLLVHPHDFIIKNNGGEIYACNPDTFRNRYDEVKE